MSKGTAAYVAIEGNLALSLNQPHFRVIEGGRSDGGRTSARSTRPSSATAQRQVVRAMSRAKAPAHDWHALCVVTSLFVVTMLAVTWRVTDIANQHRIDAALSQATFQTVTVMPGDSLWVIAERNPIEGCSTSELVRCIRDINEIDDACLQTGMRLSVPHSL